MCQPEKIFGGDFPEHEAKAEPEPCKKEIRGKKVDPGRVNEKLRECSVIPLE